MEENVEHHCVGGIERKESDWPRLDTRDRRKSEND